MVRSGKIAKIHCFSRENCKCLLCLAMGAPCVETVVRRILMLHFTAFHTQTFISSKQTYRRKRISFLIHVVTSCGFYNKLGALIPQHKSHHFNAGTVWTSQGACKVAPGISWPVIVLTLIASLLQ